MDADALTVHLAADHAGFVLKNEIKHWLEKEGYLVTDHGTHELDKNDDFTDCIIPAAKAISERPQNNRGVIFGGSGQGEAMVANRFPGVRATVFYGGDEKIITLSREHNDANVLSIGARFVSVDVAKKIIWDWLHTEGPTEEKYLRRNTEIDSLTNFLRS